MAKKDNALKLLIALSFVSMLVINGLAGGTDLIGGIRTATVSDDYPTMITPAGYTFSIWGLIYVLLGAFVVFVIARKEGEKYVGRIGWLFVLSCALNITWIFLWQYLLLIPSVFVILLFFGTLAKIYIEIGPERGSAKGLEKWAVQIPFSVYFGWLTIATIANITVALVSAGWDGFGITPLAWAIVVLLTALAIAAAVVLKKKDAAYGLVLAWALLGGSFGPSSVREVTLLAQGCAAAVLVLASWAFLAKRKK
jgi:translocator protein